MDKLVVNISAVWLAFTQSTDFAAAKTAIFIASIIVAIIGTLILYLSHETSNADNAKGTSLVRSID